MPLKDRQRIARREWLLEHVLAVIVTVSAVVVVVVIVLMLAGFH
jgi:hypothetical protein